MASSLTVTFQLDKIDLDLLVRALEYAQDDQELDEEDVHNFDALREGFSFALYTLEQDHLEEERVRLDGES